MDARKRFEPINESINATYAHLNKEVREGSGPVVLRLQKVLTYVHDAAIPELRKAILQPHDAQSNRVSGNPAAAAPSSAGCKTNGLH